MSTDAEITTLPLFPLHSVLFPLSPLQLHIFEERYKIMINDCIARKEPFGVALIQEGPEVGPPANPFEIGCMAHILAVRRLDDGRLFLLAVGGHRFRLLDYRESEAGFLIGQVEMLEDNPISAFETLELHNELSALFLRYLTLLTGRDDLSDSNLTLPDDPALLTFTVAAVAQWPLLIKQQILESTDPLSRLEEEVIRLRGEVEEMEASRIRQAAQSESEGEQTVTMHVRSVGEDEENLKQYRHQGRN